LKNKGLHRCDAFILTLGYKILFNYPENKQSYAILYMTAQ